jgi:cytochrome c biogenesis protein CcdA
MISKTNLHEAQSKFFNLFIYISYALLFISALGISQTAPKYLDSMEYYIRIYICLFLMWRFNPLKEKYEFTELDRKIAFSAGLFILTTTALNQYLEQLKEIVKNII